MIIYTGKAKGLTYEMIVRAYLIYTRPIEKLEATDFNWN